MRINLLRHNEVKMSHNMRLGGNFLEKRGYFAQVVNRVTILNTAHKMHILRLESNVRL